MTVPIPDPTLLLIVEPGGGVLRSFAPEDDEAARDYAIQYLSVVVPVTAVYDGRTEQGRE